jgi:hypothetical protein
MKTPRVFRKAAVATALAAVAASALGLSAEAALSPLTPQNYVDVNDCRVSVGAQLRSDRKAVGLARISCASPQPSVTLSVRLWRWNANTGEWLSSTPSRKTWSNLTLVELPTPSQCGIDTYWVTEVTYSIANRNGVQAGTLQNDMARYFPPC